MQMKLAKRPSHLMEVEDSDRPLDAPLAKPSLQPCPQHKTCEYCLKSGTYNATARKVMNYVVYGPGDQLKSDCSFKKTESIAPIRSTHPVSPLGGNLGPTGRITSLIPSIQHGVILKRDQELGQMVEGGEHMIWLKRKSRYWWSENRKGCSISENGTLKVLTVTIVPIFSMSESW